MRPGQFLGSELRRVRTILVIAQIIKLFVFDKFHNFIRGLIEFHPILLHPVIGQQLPVSVLAGQQCVSNKHRVPEKWGHRGWLCQIIKKDQVFRQYQVVVEQKPDPMSTFLFFFSEHRNALVLIRVENSWVDRIGFQGIAERIARVEVWEPRVLNRFHHDYFTNQDHAS